MARRHQFQRVTNICSPDYCVAVFGVILIVSLFQWIIDGRKNFTGPRMDVDVISGQVAMGGEATEEVVQQTDFHEK